MYCDGASRTYAFRGSIVTSAASSASTASAVNRTPPAPSNIFVRNAIRGVLYDLRFAVRRLARQPGWTALSAGTLALGLAATIVATVLVRDVLLQPLPFPQSDRLVRIVERSDNGRGWWPSFPNAADWRAQATFFTGVGIADIPAVRPVALNGTAGAGARARAPRRVFWAPRGPPGARPPLFA